VTGFYLVVGKFTLPMFILFFFQFLDGAILIYLANLFQRMCKSVGRRHESNDTPQKTKFLLQFDKFSLLPSSDFSPPKQNCHTWSHRRPLILGMPNQRLYPNFCTWLTMREILVLIMYRRRNPFEGFLGFKCLAEQWKPKVGPENLRRPKKGVPSPTWWTF
jgi:hypothetical protein